MASLRICRQCGEKGHDRRNCPELSMSIAERKRQDRLEIPSIIHMGKSGRTGYLCGLKKREIPIKYNTNEYMSKLPICEECKRRYENVK